MTFVELLNKALNDQRFALLLASNPHAALNEVGIEPTPERVEAVRLAMHALKAANIAFGGKVVDNI